MSLWSPLPISRLNQEGQKGSNVPVYDFPYPGSLCAVAKPFGRGGGRMFTEEDPDFASLTNPTLLDKTPSPDSF
jgi:hypothetical protein